MRFRFAAKKFGVRSQTGRALRRSPFRLGDAMELREYYRKVREVEAGIVEPFVTVVSRKTPEAGRKGLKTMVTRAVAARLIVDGKADLEE